MTLVPEPITVIGETATPVIIPAPNIVIHLKPQWGDTWEFEPELQLVRLVEAAAGKDLGVCEVKRRYGRVKEAYVSVEDLGDPPVLPSRQSWYLPGYWLRISAIDEWNNRQTMWIGRISGEGREVHGRDVLDADSEKQPSGAQTWVAHSALQILRKIKVSQAWTLVAQPLAAGETEVTYAEKLLGRIPPMNRRASGGALIGTRSASQSMSEEYESSWLYGGTEHWTNRQYLEYILRRFVNPTATEGNQVRPQWRLGGQVELLDELREPLELAKTQSVAQIIRRLIPVTRGMDFHIVPYFDAGAAAGQESGFELQVYGLTAENVSFRDVTLPKNPNTVRVVTNKAMDMKVRSVRTAEHEYSKIRIVGERIVCVCTLRGAGWVEAEDPASLVPKWIGATHTGTRTGQAGAAQWVDFAEPFDYVPDVMVSLYDPAADAGVNVRLVEAGKDYFIWANDREAGGDDVTINWEAGGPEVGYRAGTGDSASGRKEHAKARKVPRFADVYRLFGAPDDWDLNAGKAAPKLGADGKLLTLDEVEGPADLVADFQLRDRQTLSWLPLRAGIDYSVDPPTVIGGDDSSMALTPPMAWAFDVKTGMLACCAEMGMTIKVLKDDWGVHLTVNPNLLLARNHWDPAAPGEGGTKPLYDYDQLIVTLALRTDQRLVLEYELPDAPVLPPSDGSVMEIPVGGEFWYVAPKTVVGVKDGVAQVLPQADGLILRDDGDRLALAMAGALARYQFERARAEITVPGLVADWPGLVTRILTQVEEGGDVDVIMAPITSVVIQEAGEEGYSTILNTGFA